MSFGKSLFKMLSHEYQKRTVPHLKRAIRRLEEFKMECLFQWVRDDVSALITKLKAGMAEIERQLNPEGL
jgi:hypothetical protein